MIDFDKALLDAAWKNLETHKIRFKDIDTKAIGIITITGILITFLSKPVNNSCISISLYLITLISFLITILLCLGVIMVREHEALSTNNLINELSDEVEKIKIKRIIGTIGATEKSMCEATKSKAECLKFAICGLGFSIILSIIYSLSTFM